LGFGAENGAKAHFNPKFKEILETSPKPHKNDTISKLKLFSWILDSRKLCKIELQASNLSNKENHFLLWKQRYVSFSFFFT
jgi:hypothetical protein